MYFFLCEILRFEVYFNINILERLRALYLFKNKITLQEHNLPNNCASSVLGEVERESGTMHT